jgi:hypothetical protein
MYRFTLTLAVALATALAPVSSAGTRDAVPPSLNPALAPEPAYTMGSTNTLYWQPVTGWVPDATNRHYDILVRDQTTGAERTIGVAGAGTSSYTVTAAQFPTPPAGRTFSYEIRASEHYCTEVVADQCVKRAWLTSAWSNPRSSTQDATPPVVSGVLLENGAAFTSGRRVAVHLDANDPGAHPSGLAGVQFSSDPSLPCPMLGLCDEPFAANTFVDLPAGTDGVRTMYVRVYDAAQPAGSGAAIGRGRFGTPTGNASNVVSDTIVLDTVAPTVVVKRTPEPQRAGEPVTLDASASSDNGGFNADSGVDAGSAIWDFGDGTKSSGLAVSHTYRSPGTYTAQFTLRDNAGNAETTSTPVTIMPATWGGTGTATQTTKAPPTTPQPTDATPPDVSHVRVVRQKGRLQLTLVVSEPATLVVQVDRLRPRPRRTVAVRNIAVTAGRSKEILVRALRSASYRVLVAARDQAGNSSSTHAVVVRAAKRARK